MMFCSFSHLHEMDNRGRKGRFCFSFWIKCSSRFWNQWTCVVAINCCWDNRFQSMILARNWRVSCFLYFESFWVIIHAMSNLMWFHGKATFVWQYLLQKESKSQWMYSICILRQKGLQKLSFSEYYNTGTQTETETERGEEIYQ